MDPVTAVANALGQLFGAVGNPISINQERRLIESQSRYDYADQLAAQQAQQQQNEFYLIIAGIALLAVVIIAATKTK